MPGDGSNWTGVSRIYRTPRILDRQITLDDYEGPIRQIAVMDLGHEEPTLLLTNQLHRSPAKLLERYARRMLIENNIEDGVNFFHMDSLSQRGGIESQLRRATDADGEQPVPLSRSANRSRLRDGKVAHLFRDFIDANGDA